MDKPDNIIHVLGYIEENLWTPLELQHLAEKANLSKFHFCRVFKRHIGLNPMKYVSVMRIERAKELLKQGNSPVSLVANEVGFRDLSNFIRQFKRTTGLTPTMFRSTARMEYATRVRAQAQREQ